MIDHPVLNNKHPRLFVCLHIQKTVRLKVACLILGRRPDGIEG